MRWFIPGPQPGETIESIVYRAAAAYKMDPGTLWGELCDGLPNADLGQPGTLSLHRMAGAIGVRPTELLQHRCPAAMDLMPLAARQSFCPMCWHDDRLAGRPRFFRVAWAYALTLHCPIHDCALVASDNPAPTDAFIDRHCALWATLSASSRAVIAALDGTAFAMKNHESGEGRRLASQQKRARMLQWCTNLLDAPRAAPMYGLVTPTVLASYLHDRSPPPAVLRHDPWAEFLSMADPAERRRAVWAADHAAEAVFSFECGVFVPPTPRRRRWKAALEAAHAGRTLVVSVDDR